MAKIHILSILLLLPLTMRSQEDICIGKKYAMNSAILQEERQYWIHLPENYEQEPEQTHPVIYLLDGDSFFHSLVGIIQTLASGRGKSLPSCIIVGVLNTDRTRDLTPTASTSGRDGKIAPGAILQGGGGETFTRFLTEELRSMIDHTYRTNGQNMLIGHSYGGLFTLNMFLKHTEQFDTYLALDPSLWWDQGQLAAEADSLIRSKDFQGKSLYIGVATQPRTDRTANSIHQDTMNTFLTETIPQARNLHFHSRLFPDEHHGSIPVPGIYDGIKQLFNKQVN